MLVMVTMATDPKGELDVLSAEMDLMQQRGTTPAHRAVKTLTLVETPGQHRLMIVVSSTNYYTNTINKKAFQYDTYRPRQ